MTGPIRPLRDGPTRDSGGQRAGTFVLYLSEVEEGGGIRFPQAGALTVRPHKGGAVFFANVDPQGCPDPLTRHAGDPMVSGFKRIATQWVRARPF